jgi:hypothetical protein
MRGLKALVIGMGVLIVIGFVVIVVTLVNRSGLKSVGDSSAASNPPVSAAPYKAKIKIPAGARIAETDADNGRLIIRLTLQDGVTRILIIDQTTGGRIGVIDLTQAKP